MPRHFREFGVIADHHADRATVGRNGFRAIAAFDVPPAHFAGRRVQLVLCVDRAAAQKYIGNIADIAIFHPRRMGAADDVDMVGNRQFLHELLEPVGIFRDLLDRLGRLQLLAFQR